MKHRKNRLLITAAAVAAGAFGLHARTVAWYHFNEGANGAAMQGGEGVYAVVNSVDP